MYLSIEKTNSAMTRSPFVLFFIIIFFFFFSLAAQVILAQASSQKGPPRKASPAKRPAPAKKPVAGNGRIDLNVIGEFPGGSSKPVVGRDFLLLTVDPDALKAQIEKEIPLPDASVRAPQKSLATTGQERADLEQVAHEFNISVAFVNLAQKALQPAATYVDEPRYRRVEDYGQLEELRKTYAQLIKKKAKKGNVSLLRDDQKLELAKALEAEFNKLPPTDKTTLAARLAQLMAGREKQAFEQRRQQIEARNAAMERRIKRREELLASMEKSGKALRVTSDGSGIARFSRLLPGNYWAYAESFTHEGITTSWNIPIPLRKNEVRRIELVIEPR
jgi:hypothetical protein